jgi:hypothetical protein
MGASHSPMTSNAIERETRALLEFLFNVDSSEAVFQQAFGVVEAALGRHSLPFARDSARVQAFRDEVQNKAIEVHNAELA